MGYEYVTSSTRADVVLKSWRHDGLHFCISVCLKLTMVMFGVYWLYALWTKRYWYTGVNRANVIYWWRHSSARLRINICFHTKLAKFGVYRVCGVHSSTLTHALLRDDYPILMTSQSVMMTSCSTVFYVFLFLFKHNMVAYGVLWLYTLKIEWY